MRWVELPDDVFDELTDERWSGRTHYRRATYAQGCHGPLCRRRERDDQRAATRARRSAAGFDRVPSYHKDDLDRLIEKIDKYMTGLTPSQRRDKAARAKRRRKLNEGPQR